VAREGMGAGGRNEPSLYTHMNNKRKMKNIYIYYRAIAIKTAWNWHKNRHESQCNRIEDPHINRGSFAQLIFDKGTQNTIGEKTASSTNAAGKTGYLHAEN
jgi:hypothetical protein